MPTVLGVPLRAANAITIDQPTDLELLIAVSNTIIWLLMGLLVYIQILDNRRVEARLVQQLEIERRTFAELDRERKELMQSWKQRLERIPEEDELVEQHAGFDIVPEQATVQGTGLHVEADLLEAMEEELMEPREEEDDIGSEDEDGDGLEMVRMPAGREPDREHEAVVHGQ
ncbi:hypothetical protein A1O7_08059 [Cladophialophora yegresii CBS 114405]|uniref:Uncharacterized protein n=1 Tax=Cladophialophora yegresii CBS 114405 TaxID=1182544 RepID=W9W998_9EURO|nr:uncharacterized protein A1O7_08059 [Cladophialophora yegresii CBS 114405]EXJ55134.1 hypothetical protein A1O7_08059 [Cladophialophora yegresii CBS 114405]